MADAPTTQSETKMGRPTLYTPQLAAEFCARLATGKSVRTVCLDKDMPERATIYRWIRAHKDFCDQYTHAKNDGIEALVEETLDIADDSTNDWIEVRDKKGELTGYTFNKEAAARSKIRIDARHWMAMKLKPKVYGLNPIGIQPLDKEGNPTDAFNPAAAAEAVLAAVLGAGIKLDDKDEE